jgi:hypothetical protein
VQFRRETLTPAQKRARKRNRKVKGMQYNKRVGEFQAQMQGGCRSSIESSHLALP